MKYLKHITLILIVSIAMSQHGYTQSIDSLNVKQAGYLKQLLSLSDNQYTSVKNSCYTMLSDMNSLNKQDLSAENRSARLQQLVSTYRNALKNLFTTDQWNNYQAACSAIRQTFEQHIQNQNTKYNFLNNQ